MRWEGHVIRMGEGRGAYRVFFCSGNLTERDHLENLCLDGRIILKRVFRKLGGGMDWIAVVQDRDKRWALVNVVMNIRVHKSAGNFLISWETLCFSRILVHGFNYLVFINIMDYQAIVLWFPARVRLCLRPNTPRKALGSTGPSI